MITWFQSVWQDALHAFTAFRRQRVFVISVVVVLGLGIGLVTALFTVLNATILRPWRVRDPQGIVLVRARPTAGQPFGVISFAEYFYLREHLQSVSDLAMSIRGGERIQYVRGGESEHRQLQFVSANYFQTLQETVQVGRGFVAADEDYRTPRPVVIIGDRLWRDRFAASPSIAGTTILIREQPFTVIGVAERGFADVVASRIDLWLPLSTLPLGSSGISAEVFRDPVHPGGLIAARLRKGTSRSQAEAEMDALSRRFRLSVSIPSNGLVTTDTRPMNQPNDALRRQVSILSLLSLSLALILLVACANVGNILLARALSRQREIAIRLSLGASRRRVVRQLVTETLLLSSMAGAVAFGMAALAPALILSLANNTLSRPEYFAPDGTVLVFALALSVVAALAAGLAPALRVTKTPSLAALTSRYGAQTGAGSLRSVLLATQVAVSAVLLLSASLLTRAVSHVSSFQPNVAVNDVQVATVVLPADVAEERRQAVYRSLRDHSYPSPFLGVAWDLDSPFMTNGRTLWLRHPHDGLETYRPLALRTVSTNYFAVLGIKLLSGRAFEADSNRREIVVSESAARQLWGNESAIGKSLISRGSGGVTGEAHSVVGVARDVQVMPTTPEPVIYLTVNNPPDPLFVIRGPVLEARDRFQTVVSALEPAARISSRSLVDSLRQAASDSILGSRVAWSVGIVALCLAFVGSFGMFSYTVEERHREIGVRLALGASPARIIGFLLSLSGRPVLAGVVGGFGLSWLVTPVLRQFLYGLSPFDPIAYMQVVLIIAVAAVFATCVPAWRASRVDPTVALQAE
jgi:putative ABC transport system permease protein